MDGDWVTTGEVLSSRLGSMGGTADGVDSIPVSCVPVGSSSLAEWCCEACADCDRVFMEPTESCDILKTGHKSVGR